MTPAIQTASVRSPALPVVPNADRRPNGPDATEQAAAFAIHMRVMEQGHALIGEETRRYFTDDEE